MIKNTTASELQNLHADSPEIELIDVRTPAEFQEVHVEFAKNIPLDRLNAKEFKETRNGKTDQPVYLICKAGNRSKMACEKLIAAGLDEVHSIEGGTEACVQAGLPVVRGKKVMSLERQVRIAAGLLVLLGVVLGFTLHQAWFGLAGFVGAGLTFAGITDTCGDGDVDREDALESSGNQRAFDSNINSAFIHTLRRIN